MSELYVKSALDLLAHKMLLIGKKFTLFALAFVCVSVCVRAPAVYLFKSFSYIDSLMFLVNKNVVVACNTLIAASL